eukprot:Lankesteria_metandrocarpae@DN11052_c0_g1_i1.p1
MSEAHLEIPSPNAPEENQIAVNNLNRAIESTLAEDDLFSVVKQVNAQAPPEKRVEQSTTTITEQAAPQTAQQSVPHERLAIIPGGSLALAQHIMVETRRNGGGRKPDGSLVMVDLKTLAELHDNLLKIYSHTKREQVRLRRQIWKYYANGQVGQLN